ncbi:hypothetical protein BD310DRAFT_952484 [Dichomitus squalens]|uniref:Uncharacterized protein n=1 Tax=Dichomitus squalens TaxID=114155 RepID=A0A4Q9PDD1_9APHY|nr:hypothetical protein BD310DRAFT_952484 [Dichomitus squalens]
MYTDGLPPSIVSPISSGGPNTSNKRSRIESEEQSRRSPVEQERVAQHKQPVPPVQTPAAPTPIYRGNPPPVAPTNLQALQIPDSDFPHAHVPEFRIFGNVSVDQVQRIRDISNPKVAIVIHGGGQELVAAGGPLKEKIFQLLSAITFPPAASQSMVIDGSALDGSGSPPSNSPSSAIHIHLPIPRKSRQTSAFNQPWCWFVDLGPNSQRLCEWLLFQEVFPISPALSFSVHPFTATVQPWNIMVLTGLDECAVEDSDAARRQVLKDIKAYLWKDRDFTVRTARHVQKYWGLNGDPVSLLKAASDTLHVVNVVAELKTSRKEVPAYLVYAKPVSNDKSEHLEWAAKFTSPDAYWRGAFRLDINKAAVECKLCKDTSHCARACPLATDGWTGTVVEDIYTTQELEARAAGSSTSASSRADHDWQQVKERRLDRDTRAPTVGKHSQKKKQKGPRRDSQGKGKGVRR